MIIYNNFLIEDIDVMRVSLKQQNQGIYYYYQASLAALHEILDSVMTKGVSWKSLDNAASEMGLFCMALHDKQINKWNELEQGKYNPFYWN